MGRQLFLHHYLPAHLASALVTGALLEFLCTLDPIALEEAVSNNTLTNGVKSLKNVDSATKKDGVAPGFGKRHLTAKERMGHGHLLALWGTTGLVLALVIGGWWFFLPLTYGKPGLDPEQVNARKWLGYDLHFAK